MEWISVKDRLPEMGQLVVVLRNLGDGISIYGTHWNDEDLKYMDWNNITHWMPLPSPPTIKDKE